MAHSRELDINDDRIAYKSSVAAIPAALALAEKIGGVSGKDFIAAVCVGVDFGIRLGLAINPKPAHAQAIALGPLAAAAACGKILGLDKAALFNALGIAYCRVSFTGNSTVSPSLTKRLGIGFASQSGVLSSLLAAAGFPAAGEIFQGQSGFFQFFYGQEGDYDAILDQLGSRLRLAQSEVVLGFLGFQFGSQLEVLAGLGQPALCLLQLAGQSVPARLRRPQSQGPLDQGQGFFVLASLNRSLCGQGLHRRRP